MLLAAATINMIKLQDPWIAAVAAGVTGVIEIPEDNRSNELTTLFIVIFHVSVPLMIIFLIANLIVLSISFNVFEIIDPLSNFFMCSIYTANNHTND